VKGMSVPAAAEIVLVILLSLVPRSHTYTKEDNRTKGSSPANEVHQLDSIS
jgi:hypothetical protein